MATFLDLAEGSGLVGRAVDGPGWTDEIGSSTGVSL